MNLQSTTARPAALILIFIFIFALTSGCSTGSRAEENEQEGSELQPQEIYELEKEQNNGQVKEAVNEHDDREDSPVFEHNVRMNIDNAVQIESEDDWWDRF